MKSLLRPLVLVTIALAVPIVPFLLMAGSFDARVEALTQRSLAPVPFAAMIFGLLATDVFLPVPSSPLSTLAGARFGPTIGTLIVAAGMTMGAMLGFAIARAWGRPVVARWITAADLTRLESLAARHGVWLLNLTRPLPVLAEASVLLVGSLRLGWREFLLGIVPVNFALALAYTLLGSFAHDGRWLAAALVASVVVPLSATWAMRFWKPLGPGSGCATNQGEGKHSPTRNGCPL